VNHRFRKAGVVQAPLAAASDGTLLVNAAHLATKVSLAAAVRVARESGLPIFIGVALPPARAGEMMPEIDDALADVVGRLGPSLMPRRRRAR
jgi:hypothetical protein